MNGHDNPQAGVIGLGGTAVDSNLGCVIGRVVDLYLGDGAGDLTNNASIELIYEG